MRAQIAVAAALDHLFDRGLILSVENIMPSPLVVCIETLNGFTVQISELSSGVVLFEKVFEYRGEEVNVTFATERESDIIFSLEKIPD